MRSLTAPKEHPDDWMHEQAMLVNKPSYTYTVGDAGNFYAPILTNVSMPATTMFSANALMQGSAGTT